MRIIILFILFSSATFAQEKNCSDFKTGKFIYLHPDHSQWKVLRTQNTQIETENIFGMTIESSIEWI